jgi:hypothetical protein
MPKSVMISLLRKGETGDQILEILDTLIESSDTNEPTSELLFFCVWIKNCFFVNFICGV